MSFCCNMIKMTLHEVMRHTNASNLTIKLDEIVKVVLVLKLNDQSGVRSKVYSPFGLFILYFLTFPKKMIIILLTHYFFIFN